MNKSEVVGFACGTFEFLHTGHLDLLKHAKARCGRLVVGIWADAVLPLMDRMDVVGSVRYVDMTMPMYDQDVVAACRKVGATVFFTGMAKYDSKWRIQEKALSEAGIELVCLPDAESVSARKADTILAELRNQTR